MQVSSDRRQRDPKHISLAVIAGLISLVIILALIARSRIPGKQAPVSVRVDDNITLHLVDALTDDKNYFVKRSWKSVLGETLPPKWANSLQSVPWLRPERSDFGYNPGPTGTLAIFEARFPDEWSASKSVGSIANVKITAALKAAGMKMYRAEIAPGIYGDPMDTMSFPILLRHRKNDYRYWGFELNGLSQTQKQVGLRFANSSSIDAFDNGRSVYFPNPLYGQVSPLENPVKLPASVTHDGVTITLQSVVCKTILSGNRISIDGQSGEDLSRYNKYLRAEGTPADPYRTVALANIDDGTSDSSYKVRNVEVTYGKMAVPYKAGFAPAHGYGPLGSIRSSTDDCIFYRDLSAIDQPVRLSYSVVRYKDFKADEIQRIDISIPTTGTVVGPLRTGSFWNGPVSVSASNNQQFPSPHFATATPRQGALSVLVSDASDSVEVQHAELIARDGSTTNITERAMVPSRGGLTSFASVAGSDHTLSLTYLLNTANSHRDPIDFTDYTTLSLTLVSPRKIEKSFDFIIEPEEATVPAAPRQ